MPWYVVSIDVDTDKFLQKYAGLPATVRAAVSDMIYFRKTDKGIYERDAGGMYSGYVFMETVSSAVLKLHEHLMETRLGSVLGVEEAGKPSVLTPEEVTDIRNVMLSQKDGEFPVGSSVRITYGPYEDMIGEVVQIVGPVARVKVPLRKGFSYAEISLGNLAKVEA